MKDINTITVSGAVASTPEIKHVGQRNTAMLTFRIYSEREYAYQGNVSVDKSYFDVKVWGDHAEDVAKNLREGNRVTIQGRLTQESWESQGKRNYKVLIIADAVVNNDHRTASSYEPHPAVDERPAGFPVNAYTKPAPPKFDDSPLDVKATVFDVTGEDIDDIPF